MRLFGSLFSEIYCDAVAFAVHTSPISVFDSLRSRDPYAVSLGVSVFVTVPLAHVRIYLFTIFSESSSMMILSISSHDVKMCVTCQIPPVFG